MSEQKEGRVNTAEGKPYDLTEKASERPGSGGDARASGATDAQEEWNRSTGQSLSRPEGDSMGENRVSTSLSED